MVALASIGLAACGASSSTSSPTTSPSTVPSTIVSPPAPVTLGSFPHTPHGNLALAICEQWAGLQRRYYALLADRNTTPFQLDQWFSSPDWGPVRSGLLGLANDPAYTKLSTAIGVAMNGGTATVFNAQAVDQACSSGSA